MHKVFEIKGNTKCVYREGAYFIPGNNGKIGVIKTYKGYFLLGGLDKNETDEKCIKRECLEEAAGYTIVIKEKICSTEVFTTHSRLGYFHPI